MVRVDGDKSMIQYEDRMGPFFEALSELENPTVRFMDYQDAPLLAVNKMGIEALAPIVIGRYDLRLDPIFSGESCLLWDEVLSVDFEKKRLGAHHDLQIRFLNLDAIYQRLSEDKVWLLKRTLDRMGLPSNHYRLPHNGVHKIKIHDSEIDGTEVEAVLKGFSGKQRTRAVEAVFRKLTDRPVQIVEEGYEGGQQDLTDVDKALLASHVRRMRHIFRR
jgi:hypothetical protein